MAARIRGDQSSAWTHLDLPGSGCLVDNVLRAEPPFTFLAAEDERGHVSSEHVERAE